MKKLNVLVSAIILLNAVVFTMDLAKANDESTGKEKVSIGTPSNETELVAFVNFGSGSCERSWKGTSHKRFYGH